MNGQELEPLRNEKDTTVEIDNDFETSGDSKNENCCRRVKAIIKDNLFVFLTVTGVIIGFLLGFCIRLLKLSPFVVTWLQIPGDIFVRLLTMTILPLIVGSVVVVTSKLDPKANGKISLVSFVFIVVANILASLIGLFSSLVIQPGYSTFSVKNYTAMNQGESSIPSGKMLSTSDVFIDLLMNIFPDNLVAACVFKTQTRYQKKYDKAVHALIDAVNSTTFGNNSLLNSGSESTFLEHAVIFEERIVSQSYAMNMVGILFISCIFGTSARLCGPKAKPFLDFFEALTDVVTVVMRGLLWLTPIGVCFMIVGAVAAVENMVDTVTRLGLFIITVTVGLAIHFIILNIAFVAVSCKNPLPFLKHVFNSWFISFATTVPVIAIPEMYECCDKYKIKQEVSRFVVPFAAAMKGDGATVFIASAAVFVAQITNFDLSIANLVVIVLLTASAAMALPNIPSGGIIIVITILNSIGCPIKASALLFAVDWLLDRLRSGSIALSHCYCAVFTDFICTKDVNETERVETKPDSCISSATSTAKQFTMDIDDSNQSVSDVRCNENGYTCA